MGEVYRALDTKLGRAVAIKVLPDSVAHEADRRNRLEREARALAALNHPHIGAIYGFEESGDVAALVLEFVDGPTLDQRLARGPTLDRRDHSYRAAARRGARGGARQRHRASRSEAGEHQDHPRRQRQGARLRLGQGHRRADRGRGGSSIATTATATQHGMIVGTPGYMSPEQARGDAVDKRADIWAFGCVVFEMCSGRAPFAGATIAEATAAVIEREPAWETLPASTPALSRAPPSSLPDEGSEAAPARHRRGAHRALQGADSAKRGSRRCRSATTSVAAMGAAIAVLLGVARSSLSARWSVSGPPTSTPRRRACVSRVPARGVFFDRHRARTFFALSPDGSQLAFVASRRSRVAGLSARDVGSRGAAASRHRRRQLGVLVARWPLAGVL